MKKLSAQSFGFTLIELLIVIALLGALAVGLLATIDPFEQLKKGRDTSLRNTVAEFYNANLRYYSTKGEIRVDVAGFRVVHYGAHECRRTEKPVSGPCRDGESGKNLRKFDGSRAFGKLFPAGIESISGRSQYDI